MWSMKILKEIRLSRDSQRVEFCDERWFLPTPEDALEWFSILEAGWIYDGNPAHPHAKLALSTLFRNFIVRAI